MTNFEEIEDTRDLIISISEKGGRYFFTNEEWMSFFDWYEGKGQEAVYLKFVQLCPCGELEVKQGGKLKNYTPNPSQVGKEIDAVIELGSDGVPRVLFGFKGTIEI